MTKPERSWVLYDVGNSAYVLLASTLIPIYFSAIADPNSSAVVAWGYASTVASLVLALLMPFLGSLADLKGNKKKFLAGTIGTGAVSLAVMGVPGNAMVFLAIYVFSSVMLNASLVFDDHWTLRAYARNLLDNKGEMARTTMADGLNRPSFLAISPLQPRTIGVALDMAF